MKRATVPSSWLLHSGRRLDAGPYTKGALESRMRLEELEAPKQPLRELTAGYEGGIYNGPHFRRNWVQDERYGIPFLTGSSMLLADLSHLPLIRKSDALSPALFYLRLRPGMTLISSSGTIGRIAYTRPDMDGMWSSQDAMKVVPDHAKVPPGYLYAYLSSKYGLPLIISGTYGSIIQHLEPQHIADLPVPRFSPPLEETVHALVDQAACLRTRASQSRAQAVTAVERKLGWSETPLNGPTSYATSSSLQRRMDAFHYSPAVSIARLALSDQEASAPLGDLVEEVFEPNRGARSKVESTNHGVPFLSSSQVFNLDPRGEYLVSKSRTAQLDRLLLTDCDLLLPRSGQIGGIIGRAVLPLPTCYGHAATEHLVRVRCKTSDDAMFLWAIFSCQPGYYASIGTAYGTSIPSLDCAIIADLRVPWWKGSVREHIVNLVGAITDDQLTAIYSERKAIALVERTIEGTL